MTSDRSYRKALPVERALEELVLHRGTQFNAAVVDTVLALHRRGEFDIIPDSAVEKVIRQIQRVGEPPVRAIPTPFKEDPVHEVQR
jgi:HD-GYP domain-containing protein (c-di-GMP phosphodiesterase class II)